MSTKRTPDEWCALTRARILDPDGWRHDNKPWSEPITYADFRDRWQQCTVDGRAVPPTEEPHPMTEDRAADALREKVARVLFDQSDDGLDAPWEDWSERAQEGWRRLADKILAALDLPALLAAERARGRAEERARIIADLRAEREEFIQALRSSREADPDYWRWQGHAEARRRIAERLEAEPAPGEDADRADTEGHKHVFVGRRCTGCGYVMPPAAAEPAASTGEGDRRG